MSALRASTTEGNNLAEAFQRAIEDGGRRSVISASLTVTGNAGKCIRSSAMRSTESATKRFATRTPTHAPPASRSPSATAVIFALSVADDGVGMEPPITERGKEGQFGLAQACANAHLESARCP